MNLSLDEVEARISGMSKKQREDLVKSVSHVLAKPWIPQPGPQSDAYYSLADEMLYGGAAGGGKSDLLCGVSLTLHKRSLIFRSQSNDLDDLWSRLTDLSTDITVSNNSVKKKLTTTDNRVIEGGHLSLPGSEKSWQGRPHDFIGFDEAAQLDEMKVAFVIRWLRSVDEGQRKRVIFATNPPMPEIRDGKFIDVGVGDWLMRWFAPWLDDAYPNPAEPGELRWCFMRAEGDRLVTVWVDGPGYYDPATGEPRPDATPDDLDAGKVSAAISRTFIKSLLKDNVFLKGTGYAEKLSSTPEPMKSMLLLGDFTIKGEDHPFQVIPTQWVLEAQERWEARQMDPETRKLIMLVLFGDVAQGGADTSVLAPLYATDYFGELVTQPGSKTPTGLEVAAMVLGARRHGALVGLDGTGGWAGDAYRTLSSHHNIEAELVVSSHDSADWTKDMMYKYANVRTAMWWNFREALDPQSEYMIALPPSTRLRAQLTAPLWGPKGKRLFIEGKDELRKRLGSSTDEADAVIGAWHLRDLALSKSSLVKRDIDIVERLNGRNPNEQEPFQFDDPLAKW